MPLDFKDQIPGLDSTPLVRLKANHAVRGRLVKQTVYGRDRENFVILDDGSIHKATDVEIVRKAPK